MDNSIARLESVSDPELVQIFKNCVRAVAKRSKFAAQAREKIPHIVAELQRRKALVEAGHAFVETPERGMLSTIGYRVGNSGEREESRRDLLDYVMEGELPLVASFAYTSQWGAPRSQARLWKLVRTLEGLAAGADGRHNMGLACTHWLEDRDYVLRKWSGSVT